MLQLIKLLLVSDKEVVVAGFLIHLHVSFILSLYLIYVIHIYSYLIESEIIISYHCSKSAILLRNPRSDNRIQKKNKHSNFRNYMSQESDSGLNLTQSSLCHKHNVKALVARLKTVLVNKIELKRQNPSIQQKFHIPIKQTCKGRQLNRSESKIKKGNELLTNQQVSSQIQSIDEENRSQSQIKIMEQKKAKKFKIILSYWKQKQFQHKNIKQKNKIPMEISFYNIGKLRPRVKLNDNVVNSYAFLIQEALNKDQQNYVKILNSWVSTTLYDFSKSKNAISRALARLKVNSFRQALIVIVNIEGHWLFLQVHNKKIYIYDSLIKKQEYYPMVYEIKALKQTFDWVFMAGHSLQVVGNYPQQTNSIDCGVMMLLGIIDVVKHSFSWSFSQEKVQYWRTKIAYDLLNEQIQDF